MISRSGKPSKIAWDVAAVLVDYLNRKDEKFTAVEGYLTPLQSAQHTVKVALLALREWNTRSPKVPPGADFGTAIKASWRMTNPERTAWLEKTFGSVQLRYALIADRRGRISVVPGLVRPDPLAEGLSILGTATEFHLLDLVRECKRCGKWLLARRPSKVYCSPYCQQETWNAYRATEAGRKEQRERLRRWRAQRRQEAQSQRRKR
jgi:hypothetical protein